MKLLCTLKQQHARKLIRYSHAVLLADPSSLSEPDITAARSDAVAEQALRCLNTLLARCNSSCERSADGLVHILERLCPILALPEEHLSEEVKSCFL